ncbi:ectoine hydroxylase [Halomonas litopenaei]|uniref:ectoine hydroxylase n=1 Tax=Halomonas litopenaei TaxID=2109328 RepID=UPI003FA11246
MTYAPNQLSTRSDDGYPTRLDEPMGNIARHCPVVHATPEQRQAGPLDERELAAFEERGFLWFDSFFEADDIEPFFDELSAMERDPELTGSDKVITDPVSGAIRSVFGMHELSERFDRLTRSPRLLKIVEQLLGGGVYVHQSRINDKAGFQGSGFDWHSDFETWHAEDGMPGMRALSVSLMLTDNGEFNGPLMLVPGSHRQFVPTVGRTPDQNWETSLKAQHIGVPTREQLGPIIEQQGIEAPKGPAGSILLFDCNALHASNSNLSPWPRSNLFFVYNSVNNRLVTPFGAKSPRPEHLAARERTPALG